VDVFGAIEEGVEDAAKAVEHGVEDAAKATESFVKKAAKAVGHAVSDAAEGVWDGVVDVAKGVGGFAVDFAGGLADGVGGFVSNLAHGRVADAFGSLAQGLDRAVIQSTQKLWNGVLDGVQDGLDGVSQLLPGPIGDAARQLIDRTADIYRTAGNTVFEGARDFYHMVVDTPIDFARNMGTVASDIFHGNFGDAAKHFGGALLQSGETLVGGAFDMATRTLQGVASIAQTATFLQPPSRKLTDEEKDLLRKVYGDTVDLDSIRVEVGGPLTNAMAAHTVGNTIYMPESDYGDTGGLPPGSLYKKDAAGNITGLTEYGSTLIHETAHAWQSENGGGKYIHESLWGQAAEEAQGKSRDADYEWTTEVPATDFADLNPEQQAHYVEQVLGPALALPGDLDTNIRKALMAAGAPADAANVAYAHQVLEDIRNRQGMA